MEMDMDIPLPEELEWLEESNALIPEEEEEEDRFVDEDDELLELCKAIPEENDLPDPKIQKRQRVEEEDGLLEDRGVGKSAEKRTKGEVFGGAGGKDFPVVENDEDWLRYSPTKNDEVEAGGSADVVSTEFVAVDEKILSRFASEIDGDCIPVTGPCGDRVYAKLSSGMVDAGIGHQMVERPAKGLLLEPINVLVERVEEEALKKVLQESFGSPSDPTTPMDSTVSEQLWVEKYAPKCFTELLSDEQTNREVLLWLKQWDSCVFGSHVRATSDDVLSSLRRQLSVAQSQHNNFSGSMNFSKKKGFPFNNHNFNRSNNLDKENKNMQESSDPWSTRCMTSTPPEQKVLLLCGPPGLGKTTLAHVAAKHCGYRVVEINASDERSSSMIESKILDVVQMNSVMSDSKPKCLVIDEIDGALGEGKGAVEAILKMVLAEKNCNHENNNPVGHPKKSSRKARKTAKLTRPVICICNDLYAPALRPLRQVAKVHIFVQPTISRVVNRLRYICKLENFKTSSIALSTLAEYTECDIRSCLNTIQFLHKKNETLDSLEIDRQVIGRKDMSRTAFDVWKEIFQKRKTKHDKKTRFLNGVSGDFESMYSLISNRGEHELTMDGVYENFLQLSYHDPMMRKTVSCLDVLGYSDSLLRYMMRTQQMFLFAYQPFVAISVKNLIAQVGRPHIEWPKSIQRCRMMLKEKKELFKLWNNKLPPPISRHLPLESFVEDFVTPLLHILSPPCLRPVALHLLSEREKDDLSQLVDTMVSYSLTYKSSKPEHTPMTDKYGASSEIQSLSLEPSIDNFISFKDHQPGHSAPPLATKQFLVHEVEKQRIIRESAGKSSSQNSGNSRKNQTPPSGHTRTFPENADNMTASSGKATPHPTNSVSNVSRSSPTVVSKLQAPGGSKKTSRRFNDFFDRFRKDPKDSRNSKNIPSATSERDSRPFMFKYNEGFTNAVKRPVRVRELLL